MQKGVKICNLDATFLGGLTSFLWPNRVIFEIGRVVDNGWMVDKSVHLHHERLMIGVQCQLMICRGHIRASKGAFQKNFLGVDYSMVN